MLDYVAVATSDVTLAVDASTAFTFKTIAAGGTLKGATFDNGFDVDMVVMLDGVKAFYLRAGQPKAFDLKSDGAEASAAGGARVLKCYAAAGVAPASGTLIADGLMS